MTMRITTIVGIFALGIFSALLMGAGQGVRVTDIEVPGGAANIAVGEGSVWVSLLTNHVARIDPRRNEVTAVIRARKHPSGIATSPGAVWVAEVEDGTVSRIDPATNQ